MPRWFRALRAAPLLLLALLISPGAARAQTDAQVLRPGDRVRITVWRNAELTGTFNVGPAGEIQHPLYRSVTVAGLAPAAVDERVRAFLRTFDANPEFLVEPLFPVTVTGRVVAPSRIDTPPGFTVARVLEQAGGIGEDGRLDRVILTRGGTRRRVSLRDPGPQGSGMLVRSGDQLRVEGRRDWRAIAQVSSYFINAATFVLATYQVLRSSSVTEGTRDGRMNPPASPRTMSGQ